tara:strand:- start:61 stop:297 length:237 start_codon:yes stop_codon:yes gene_type:complete
MARKTLYQQLKPEVKGRLHSQDEKYDETVNRIVVLLKSKYNWSDLTIEEARRVETFTDTSSQSAYQFKWGVELLVNEE